jgi:hypothetical protein
MKKVLVSLTDQRDIISLSGWELDDVRKLDTIGFQNNQWRQRNVTVYQHPINADKVVTVGESFDDTKVFICEEYKDDWKNCIRKFPRTDVFQ